MNPIRIRNTYDLSGIIQGVGFRPAMLHLASGAGLAGWVQNRTDSVRIVLEGPQKNVETFMQTLKDKLPKNAVVNTILLVESITVSENEIIDRFSILPSFQTGVHSLLIPADLAICHDCMAEITNPSDRRYGYPFTTCVNCGPRYTIINSTPYDRERTTMSVFPMCDDCRREYEDPTNRRFHAETIACPKCGPQVHMEDTSGTLLEGNAIEMARSELLKGKIVAVRGIGGFLIAADAFNRSAIEVLRRRKTRPHKPFAVMASNIEVLHRYCIVTSEAEQLLLSPEAPIVILDVRPEIIAAGELPIDLISPDTMTLGAMLPTSPLHKLFFESLLNDGVPSFKLLIMTSGNRGGEPTCITNDEARDRLKTIADFFLMHDREINLRNDDSICVMRRGQPQVWRRARGYAPNPIHLSHRMTRTVLAMGADMKNTITVAYDNCAVISPHIGDLETPEALNSIEKVTACLPEFLMKTPEAVAVDLHPDMHSTKLGEKISKQADIPVTGVQHHYAHAVACLEENGHDKGLALVFDGTGLGTDGTIWGAELLSVELVGFKRLATFAGVPLPGGDSAVKHPARQLIGRFMTCGTGITDEWVTRLGISGSEAALWSKQCLENINSPITHAAGRVFDSFAALLGFAPAKITYEGQPAIRLEAAARRCRDTSIPDLPFSVSEQDGKLLIDWNESFGMLADTSVFKGKETAFAMAVHHAVAEAALKMVEGGLGMSSMRTIALTGGVFMNRILNEILVPKLEKMGLEVILHRCTPPNDGCISFGQAIIAGK
ncbi:MAG: carbamoyltransferase HypF [Kiritimatiellae bacterium]|nr:carbamoyltransferase HypF [Kiritimatiellia bacterium]MDD5523167.1 carbamoyltransferase HypF [Kiritimatiellia bacterium]